MLNNNKIGLVFGSFLGLWHLIWSILIYFGFAQVCLDFVYNLHSLNNPFVVNEFNLVRSVCLVVITSIVGYIIGFVLSAIWNKVHR